MRRIATSLALALAVMTFGVAACKGKPKPSLKTDKPSYKAGETIEVTFTASAEYDDSAWVGLIPSDVKHGEEAENDRYDISYQYLKKRTEGTLTFTAPNEGGRWDFRLNTSDSETGLEVAYVSFRVEGESGKPMPPTVEIGGDSDVKPSLSVNRAVYAPGEQISVDFTAPGYYAENAWVGIIPSSAPHGTESENDAHDIAYQYLSKKTGGTLTFTAPNQPGDYDIRMHDTDNNGSEVATVSFSVEGEAADTSESPSSEMSMLSLMGSDFAPGSQITVEFTAPASFAENAWVGIIPSSTPHGSESENDKFDLSYQYLNKRTSGSLTFTAPNEPGEYDFRMHDTDNDGREVVSVSFTVK